MTALIVSHPGQLSGAQLRVLQIALTEIERWGIYVSSGAAVVAARKLVQFKLLERGQSDKSFKMTDLGREVAGKIQKDSR